MRIKKSIIIIASLLMLHTYAMATHLRAGEITVTPNSCSGFTFKITITVFTDLVSPVKFGNGTLNFGDGTSLETPEMDSHTRPDLGKNIGTVTYTVEHTFPGPSRYLISYFEHNRNPSVLNMFDSVNTPFSLRTEINIDRLLGCDHSPRLLVPPIDHGCVGAAWSHNPGASDPDGDSLSYEFIVPQRDRNQDVAGYVAPNSQKFYDSYNTANEQKNGPPAFTIDPVRGTINWDAPGAVGQYNIAFIVKEWRKIGPKWIVLGYVERDMQIIIEDCANKRPELKIPADICVEAGTTIDETILGTDPDNDEVQLEAFSETLGLAVSPATFTPFPAIFQSSSPNPAEGKFSWKTNCTHVKEQPYLVVFKVSDRSLKNQGPSLADYKTWQIRVVGPKPKLKTVTYDRSSGSATLSWEPYICKNASEIQVWRRVKSFPYTQVECVTGMPPQLGYTQITTVAVSTNSYNDSNKGKRLAAGALYCYRLVAVFPKPAGGKSYVSEELCLDYPIPMDRPVITHVTIDVTDVTAGELTVKWAAPDDPEAGLTPPYKYEVYRGAGLTGQKYVKAFNGQRTENIWQETTLNTKENSHNYVVQAWDAADKKTDSSKMASQVWLEARASFKKVELNWNFNVPWSNSIKEHPFHQIYRAEEGQALVLLDSIDVTTNGNHYLDNGSKIPLDNTKKYCYRIRTRGGYGNPKIKEPLENYSQMVCNVQPDLKQPPCQLTIDPTVLKGNDCATIKKEDMPCSSGSFTNTLFWPRPPDASCRSQIAYYKVYRASYMGEKFELLSEMVRDTFYLDRHLSSYASCYKISAVNLAGLEGELSETICFDNCPSFELPNVFSPNGDGCNDSFSAFSDKQKINEFGMGPCGKLDHERQRNFCARFVKSVDFTVINRYGKEVFSYLSGGEHSIYIDWDGTDETKKELPAGTYYYTCEVIFDVVDPAKQKKILKGWLQLIR